MSTAGQTSKLARTERSAMSMSDFQAEMFKLESDSESMNLLIYGDSNAGKTWLAGTSPGKNYWLIGEPGYKSAVRRGAKGYGRRITDSATAWAAVEWLEHKERFRKFDWLILDGGSSMQDKFRFNYAAEAFDINPAKRQHRNLPDKPDYFNTQNLLKAWIARLVDMPINVLITAHAYRTDASDVDLLVFPGFQGKVNETANAIAGLMDVVGYMESKRVISKDGSKSKIIRRLHFESPDNKKGDDVKYVVGDKFNCLGKYIDNPSMPEIIAKINGSTESEDDD